MTHEALREAHRIISDHSKSFSLAARFLPHHIHDNAVVLYAWCRRADDLVDGSSGIEAERRLRRLQEELNLVYGGARIEDALLDEFQRVVQECEIPRSYPDELLAGLQMDVDNQRYDDMEELLRYCYRVAGTVGLMMCHIMGVRDESATRNAVHLGIAMQLTNICRDVLEDWHRGRLYLPTSVLRRFGVQELDPRPGAVPPPTTHAAIRRATRLLLAEADLFYRSGDAGMLALAWRCSFAIRTARSVYAAIGERLRDMDFDPLRGRAIVPRRRKAALVATSFARWLAEVPPRAAERLRTTPRPAVPPKRIVNYPHDVLPLGLEWEAVT